MGANFSNHYASSECKSLVYVAFIKDGNVRSCDYLYAKQLQPSLVYTVWCLCVLARAAEAAAAVAAKKRSAFSSYKQASKQASNVSLVSHQQKTTGEKQQFFH